ncbi:MAG TPA: thioesterase family protein [Anaerolineae bacterium]|jgi:fluoroacetyl-CoA thioesterase|nr:thioesterase family protein [Anaerolineae bacterium]
MQTEALHPGLIGEAEATVVPENTAWHMGSGQIKVFATPAMIALMEEAAVRAVSDHLLPGWQTVGVHVDVQHLAATPLGLTVTARAELLEVKGRRLRFAVSAHDGQEPIGEGTHERVLIDLERFEARLGEKIDRERCGGDGA